MEVVQVNQLPQKNEADQLISQAIEKNVPVETMEKLLAMRRELRAEYAKEQFTLAMAKFQGTCPIIKKTKEVKTKAGIVAYRYAPIESIVEQVKPFLQECGFSYSTSMVLSPTGVKASCKVTHSSGHSEISEMEVPLGTKTEIMSQSQVVAAAQTFAKRYAFCNAFGILTGDEDTDARPEPKEVAPAQSKPQTENEIIKEQAKNFGGEVVNNTSKSLKTCPFCNQQHDGQYPKCIECWKKERNGQVLKPAQKTKTITNSNEAPFKS